MTTRSAALVCAYSFLLLTRITTLSALNQIHLQYEANVSMDHHLSKILPAIINNGTWSGVNDTLVPEHIDPAQVAYAVTVLESVVSLTRARDVLGLEQLYELAVPVAEPLISALSQPIPPDGQYEEVLLQLREILAAVQALMTAGSTGASGSPDTGQQEVQQDQLEDQRTPQGPRSGSNASPGPTHSFPLLRRATAARLVQLWLQHLRAAFADSGWVAQARRLVTETLLQLFELHRRGMAARHMLEFMHISKAAGTSMCHLAEVSRCRAQDFGMGRTCIMRDFDDQPRWLNASHHWAAIASVAEPKGTHPLAFLQHGLPRSADRIRTCSGRWAQLQKKKLDFFANEYTVYNEAIMVNKTGRWGASGEEPGLYGKYVQQLTVAGREGAPASSSLDSQGRGYSAVVRGTHLCPQFANVVVLREPFDRLLSHLGFIAHTYASLYQWPGLREAFRPGRDSPGWWRAFAPALADNYMLRTLAGEGVFALPYGALAGGPYLDLARAVLAQYDVVMVLEFDPSTLQRVCAYGLGWNRSLTEFQLRNATHLRHRSHSSDVEMEQLLPNKVVMEGFRTNAIQYDMLLYKYGTLLARLDDTVWGLADQVLREPLPGFLKGEVPNCGYIHLADGDGG